LHLIDFEGVAAISIRNVLRVGIRAARCSQSCKAADVRATWPWPSSVA